tara:strand:- start:2954 stop:4012 length:1059 start_codon:yes stop_codon:yes gene_type:complete
MLNFALVGCGRISKRHSELLGENKISGAKLVAVCDKILSKAEEISNKYKVNAYEDMHLMMESESIDVVVVLTESGFHAKHTFELAPYGAHIIVEKPMALTLEDADKMIDVCNKFNTELFVVKQNRFNLPVVQLRKALISERFGQLIMGTIRVRWCRTQEYYDQDYWRGTWALDGGVLTNQASHHIDLLRWMFGEVESVFAKSKTALVDIEAEDTAAAVLKFRNGALGIIEATTAIRPKDLEGSLSILGEKGSVEIGGFAVNEMKTWNFNNHQIYDEEVKKKFSVNPPNVYGFGHKAYYDHVIEYLQNRKIRPVNGVEGRKSLELINAIYHSIETGEEVSLESLPKSLNLGRP